MLYDRKNIYFASSSRAGYLDEIGVEEYEPLEIKKTAGRMKEDQQWIEVEADRRGSKRIY